MASMINRCLLAIWLTAKGIRWQWGAIGLLLVILTLIKVFYQSFEVTLSHQDNYYYIKIPLILPLSWVLLVLGGFTFFSSSTALDRPPGIDEKKFKSSSTGGLLSPRIGMKQHRMR